MLIPLWAKAVEAGREEPIIKDDKAVEIISRIDYDFSKFEKSWLSQVGVSIRTMLLDNATRNFVQRNPGTVVVNLGAGLDTRYHRLKNENITCWYDLDVPEAITIRRQFFSENDGNKFISGSAFDPLWIKEVTAAGKKILIIAEGLLMYFPAGKNRLLFGQLASRLPGSEMLFEMLAPFLVGKSKHHDSVSKMGSITEFKWSLKNSREIESWHKGIKLIEEWNFFDYHKDRWKWFGVIGRFPLFRRSFSNRIVHLKFS